MEIGMDFAPFQEQATSTLVKTTRTAAQISSEDLNFQRSSNADFSEKLDAQSSRLLGLTNSLLKVATSGSDLKAPDLRNEDAVEDNWRAVVDVIDELLEKADACLDEFTGIIKKLSPSQQERSLALGKTKDAAIKFSSVYDFAPSQIPKPQLLFERSPANTETFPFQPLLRSKPHATVPLKDSLEIAGPVGVAKSYVHCLAPCHVLASVALIRFFSPDTSIPMK
jgi:exosome complex exonuclease RRP6